MPRIKSYTPAWLSRPAPGHNLFTASSADSKTAFSTTITDTKPGPRRTIARSGSQVFVAVGREVRWADLIELKEQWQEKTSKGRQGARIKREDSESPDEDEILRASAQDGYAGFRVREDSMH
jgi:nucleoporin NUP82